jgi:succinate dehydrogenase/fumarate reductase flavoprotein subunit
MTEEKVSEEHVVEEKLADDFKELGENLVEMLRAAWDRPERKAVKEDIEKGLNEMGQVFNDAMNDFSASDVGQKVKTEVDDLKGRVDSGEVEEKIRSEMKSALSTVNGELTKLIEKMRAAETE